MGIVDKIFEIDPAKLAAGGDRVDRYEISKNFLKVGGAAIVIGLAADSAGQKWGAPLAMAGGWMEFMGGGVISIESPHLRSDDKAPAADIETGPIN